MSSLAMASTLLLALFLASCLALDGVSVPDTCNLKDNCNLGDNLLSRSGQGSDNGDVAGDKLESKIASIFEDKVNYSLKLFADEATTTILEYQTANLSELHEPGNFTLHQVHRMEATDDDDQVEEDERGESGSPRGFLKNFFVQGNEVANCDLFNRFL